MQIFKLGWSKQAQICFYDLWFWFWSKFLNMKHPFKAEYEERIEALQHELEKAKSKNEKSKDKMSKLKKVWVQN